mmetsp:Transcript_118163/g.220950  ORF Transcript_118163/g.220950 Transcript_118163/m.220950 type:complete len:537 (-) Transcript_118163:136-1746(-)
MVRKKSEVKSSAMSSSPSGHVSSEDRNQSGKSHAEAADGGELLDSTCVPIVADCLTEEVSLLEGSDFKEVRSQKTACTPVKHCAKGLESRELVTCAAFKRCIYRNEVEQIIAKSKFGERLCGRASPKASFYDGVAALARHAERVKRTDLVSRTWSLKYNSQSWLELPVNLNPRNERASFQCVPDVYSYAGAPTGTLVVDFANQHVGGGCFGSGFVQEEQMVVQSTDFAVFLNRHRERLNKFSGASYEGVHMDAWWPRDEAAKKESLDFKAIQSCESNPLTILALDAPVMRRHKTYSKDTLEMLAKKILLMYAVADNLQSPQIFTGLLGGGAFRNNRPLVLLLHLLLQPVGDDRPVIFHHPVFWSFGCDSVQTIEQRILEHADIMLQQLKGMGILSLGDALVEILRWWLPVSNDDHDVVGRQKHLPQSDVCASKSLHPSRVPGFVGSGEGKKKAKLEVEPPSALKISEKSFLRVVQNIRSVLKIEEQEKEGKKVDKKQHDKLQRKDQFLQELSAQLRNLPLDSLLREKNQDVISMVT